MAKMAWIGHFFWKMSNLITILRRFYVIIVAIID
jgi:hypothetical protein